MEYESTQREEYPNYYMTVLKAIEGLISTRESEGNRFCSDNKFYVDIRVEIPGMDAEIFEDAVDIGQEFVDLLVEQEENKYYNIYLKTVGTH